MKLVRYGQTLEHHHKDASYVHKLLYGRLVDTYATNKRHGEIQNWGRHLIYLARPPSITYRMQSVM